MALMVKCVSSMPLNGLQRLILFFKLVQLPLSYPHYLCISKQAKTINVMFKTKD
ncbi:Mobile element protein [Candidatus Enterovibrio altilux]|uniref:Mobile element protein n=1 Tax=Candidatus Enterovibrio altilux TaxID=1927128 RepID=A0A291B9H4_9GAMM|nr:Mobile element protein [Candidatus Enterovibrio luxaltus]